ncbi:MAG: hypothetical protein ACC619_09405, partial [Paracoccaceae bacterium]
SVRIRSTAMPVIISIMTNKNSEKMISDPSSLRANFRIIVLVFRRAPASRQAFVKRSSKYSNMGHLLQNNTYRKSRVCNNAPPIGFRISNTSTGKNVRITVGIDKFYANMHEITAIPAWPANVSKYGTLAQPGRENSAGVVIR